MLGFFATATGSANFLYAESSADAFLSTVFASCAEGAAFCEFCCTAAAPEAARGAGVGSELMFERFGVAVLSAGCGDALAFEFAGEGSGATVAGALAASAVVEDASDA